VTVDYGTDLKLTDDDIVFTPDGDVETVSGPACVAQDIARTLKTAPGRLAWDRDAGSSMPLMLNDSGIEAGAAVAELERVAEDDPRVDPLSVRARSVGQGRFRLEFRPLGAVAAETLEYDLKERP